MSQFGEKVEYFYGYDLHFNNEVYRPSKEIYATTLFTEYAEKVIKNHDASEPLFLFFSHLATHTGDDGIGMEVPRDVDVDETYPHIKHHGRRALAGKSNTAQRDCKSNSTEIRFILRLCGRTRQIRGTCDESTRRKENAGKLNNSTHVGQRSSHRLHWGHAA